MDEATFDLWLISVGVLGLVSVLWVVWLVALPPCRTSACGCQTCAGGGYGRLPQQSSRRPPTIMTADGLRRDMDLSMALGGGYDSEGDGGLLPELDHSPSPPPPPRRYSQRPFGGAGGAGGTDGGVPLRDALLSGLQQLNDPKLRADPAAWQALANSISETVEGALAEQAAAADAARRQRRPPSPREDSPFQQVPLGTADALADEHSRLSTAVTAVLGSGALGAGDSDVLQAAMRRVEPPIRQEHEEVDALAELRQARLSMALAESLPGVVQGDNPDLVAGPDGMMARQDGLRRGAANCIG